MWSLLLFVIATLIHFSTANQLVLKGAEDEKPQKKSNVRFKGSLFVLIIFVVT